MLVVAQKQLPPKKHSLPEGSIALLALIFITCVLVPYVIRGQYGESWGRGAVGLEAPVWIAAAVAIVRSHWRELTKKAADTVYMAVLLGFLGQLVAIVYYMWPA